MLSFRFLEMYTVCFTLYTEHVTPSNCLLLVGTVLCSSVVEVPVCPEEWCILQLTLLVTIRAAQVDLLLWMFKDHFLPTAPVQNQECI